mmetsp:Transcript_36523/g.113926  ORF Transcript_36523/g.113926 Transcript_36523/m.113926 type:complete len:231 (+) Transcript_36523:913-1605(+)
MFLAVPVSHPYVPCYPRETRKVGRIEQRKRILCFGDSLTAGYYAQGNRFHPYANLLKKLLGVEVDYIGLSGWTTRQMCDSKDSDSCVDVVRRSWRGLRAQLKRNRYTHCIILGGTNDVSASSPDMILSNLRTLHAIARQFGCKTVALTIPELAAERRQPQIHETRLRVNEAILQRKIDCDLVVDIDKVLPLAKATQVQRMSIWEPDGLHLQPEGYDTVARAISSQITQVI